MSTTLEALNHQFAIPGQLSFQAGPGDLVIAEINNRHATATLALQGAHVIAYQPHGHQPVLWASQNSPYQAGKSIRGGIPVCWPWFAAHPTDTSKPAHGFARTSLWAVTATTGAEHERTQIQLELADTPATQALWPHAFTLQLIVTVGPELQVELVTRNAGSEPFTITEALHSYFSLSHIDAIVIHGLEETAYLDKVEAFRPKRQEGPVTIHSETDRIYLDTTATCVIEDKGWRRRVSIAKTGSRSTVVWNPWRDRARAMADFGEEEYAGMVCVETANAADDIIVLSPGEAHRLEAVIKVEPDA